ncbi:unnamed protein product [Oppiella nova]|uniref:Uncharacterized protein n=1 Tax=Oppiella nova TaxID=334625 RepID=A0A7R9LTE8_9ACAR|nr:unnamed protein product [Oppiella nova]CAG2166461.1 unnamed protein product [Oppiella nova]
MFAPDCNSYNWPSHTWTNQTALLLPHPGNWVQGLDPGYILTDELVPFINPDRLSQLIESTPLHRIGQPLDVAKGVSFLASIDAHFITGANLVGFDVGITFT